MKIRKGILAITIGGALALALTCVPQASAAHRVVVVRPYFGFRPLYGPAWVYPRPDMLFVPSSIPPLVSSISTRKPKTTASMSPAAISASPTI